MAKVKTGLLGGTYVESHPKRTGKTLEILGNIP